MYLEPPETPDILFDDSAEKDSGKLIDNLYGCKLLSRAQFVLEICNNTSTEHKQTSPYK